MLHLCDTEKKAEPNQFKIQRFTFAQTNYKKNWYWC